MALIKSISGIRGTIGGRAGEGLSPLDVVKFTAAYGSWIKKNSPGRNKTIIVGRDARISGEMVDSLVTGTLVGLGMNVINIGLATTPTTEIAVQKEKAAGGIILTASHNPKQWNALKLLNEKGEFLSDKDGKEVLEIAGKEDFVFAEIDDLGTVTKNENYNCIHIEDVLRLQLVDVEAIRKANFTVAIDCVNSVGGIILPELLKALGVKNIKKLYCEPNGYFPHNPEPLPEHLTEISRLMQTEKADVGFVVDPDVDRLAIVCEDGSMFGEEYTLVSIADYVLSHTPGNTVSNLSSTRALRDITRAHGGTYTAAAVGEVNVVAKMKETAAVIGGEGNGGVIYPASHYGRDALVGMALFLSLLAKEKTKVSVLRKKYPEYYISKNKIQLTPDIDVDLILSEIKVKYKNEEINDIDGVKIDFPDKWVHLRKSNTEPIIRIYAEAHSQKEADALALNTMEVIRKLAEI
ncbi:MAG: phosphoglucosamine mutase [Prevotellaceae bacterium]|jgi:phosphomannomutase|nr:phosphoglucosamine mutase [Prevotellaceae bacterium]